MPPKRMKEIRDMSKDDLKKRMNELQTDLARQRTAVKSGGAVENPARISETRKMIARILTVKNEEKKKR